MFAKHSYGVLLHCTTLRETASGHGSRLWISLHQDSQLRLYAYYVLLIAQQLYASTPTRYDWLMYDRGSPRDCSQPRYIPQYSLRFYYRSSQRVTYQHYSQMHLIQ